MYGYKCSCCGSYCDPGELKNGICEDCIEQKEQIIVHTDRFTRLLNSPSYQMELKLEE